MYRGIYKTANDIITHTKRQQERPTMAMHRQLQQNKLVKEKFTESSTVTASKTSSPTTQTSVKSNDLSDPTIWGPSFWFTLHNGAIHYPDNPQIEYIEAMKGFIIGIPVMIPCVHCSEHARLFITPRIPFLDEICKSKSSLFTFFFEFHNEVNQHLKKPLISLEDAIKLYTYSS